MVASRLQTSWILIEWANWPRLPLKLFTLPRVVHWCHILQQWSLAEWSSSTHLSFNPKLFNFLSHFFFSNILFVDDWCIFLFRLFLNVVQPFLMFWGSPFNTLVNYVTCVNVHLNFVCQWILETQFILHFYFILHRDFGVILTDHGGFLLHIGL